MWLRGFGLIIIFAFLIYVGWKIIKAEILLERMCYLIVGSILVALFSVIAYWDPAWAAPFLTIRLLIMTVFSTINNQKLVDLNEKERQSRVYANMAVTIFSPIKEMNKDTDKLLQSGYILQKLSDNEKLPVHQKINIFFSPDLLLKRRIHNPDKVLNKYLTKIEQLSEEFEKSSNLIEKNLKNIIQKRSNIWSEFKSFCNTLISSGDCITNEVGYEMVFAFAIADAKKAYRYQNFPFYKMNRDQLRSKLIELSFKEDMDEYQRDKDALIKTMNEMDGLINGLISDWQREYNLIPSDIAPNINLV